MEEKELEKIKEYVDKYRKSCPRLNRNWKEDYETRQDACDDAFNCVYEASIIIKNIVKDSTFHSTFEGMVVPCGDGKCGTALSKFKGLEERVKKLKEEEK